MNTIWYIFVYTTKKFEALQSSGSGRSKIAIFGLFDFIFIFNNIIQKYSKSRPTIPQKKSSE